MPTDLRPFLADLKRAFPSQPVDAGMLALYQRELADIDAAILADVFRDIIRTRTNRFWPTIGEILEACAERRLELPTESQGLAQIDARIAWGRDPNAGDDPPPLHPLVRESIDQLGGFHAFKTTERPAVLRGQFINTYRANRARVLRDATLERPAIEDGSQPAQLTEG